MGLEPTTPWTTRVRGGLPQGSHAPRIARSYWRSAHAVPLHRPTVVLAGNRRPCAFALVVAASRSSRPALLHIGDETCDALVTGRCLQRAPCLGADIFTFPW
jgi:hypothetical protein